jgi:hypothetical protein
MDNNVGQNKSQAVFMFFAMLSMTWFPEAVVLLYLLPGHSHMAPDRTTGWCVLIQSKACLLSFLIIGIQID